MRDTWGMAVHCLTENQLICLAVSFSALGVFMGFFAGLQEHIRLRRHREHIVIDVTGTTSAEPEEGQISPAVRHVPPVRIQGGTYV